MPWNLPSVLLLPLLSVLFVISFLDAVDGNGTLPPVFWNSSNAFFHSTDADHILHVHQWDRLEIFCPHYPDTSAVESNKLEYYKIYIVKEKNIYDKCIINDTSNLRPILVCNTPATSKKFTVFISDFQAIPGVPDFHVNREYFLLSTSGGRPFNMDNQYHGMCKTHRMKIILKVLPPSTDTDDDDNNDGNGDGDGNDQGQPTTTPTPRGTTRRTLRPSTSSPARSTTSPKGGNNNNSTHNNNNSNNNNNNNNSNRLKRPTQKPRDGDTVPGSDGFPDDDTVIHASDGPNMNTGIIDDGDIENGGPSLLHGSSPAKMSITFAILALLVNVLLLHR